MTHNIGDILTLPEAADLPLGSKMTNNAYTYVLTEDGVFYEYGERMQLFNYEEATRFTLQSIGDGAPAVPETVEQFKDKFATLGIGAGRQSSVHGVAEALTELGIDYRTVVLRPGMYVHRSDHDRLRQIPDGTILTWGMTHETRYTRALLARVNGNQVQDLWTNHSGPSMMRVLAFPDGTEVAEWRAPREDEAVRLIQFRARCAAVGTKAKAQNSWCGVAEATMGKVFLGNTDALLGYGNTGGVWLPREADPDISPLDEYRAAAQFTTWLLTNGVMVRKFSDSTFANLNPIRNGQAWFHVPSSAMMDADAYAARLDPIVNSRMVWTPMMEPSNPTEVTEMDSWMAPVGSRAETAEGWPVTKRETDWYSGAYGVGTPSRWVKYLPFNSPEHRVQDRVALLTGTEPAHVVVTRNGYFYRSMGNARWMCHSPGDRFTASDMGTSCTWTVSHHADWSYPTAWSGVSPTRGEQATVEQMLRAPVGTMIEDEENGDLWTCDHHADGVSHWMHHNEYAGSIFTVPSDFSLSGITWRRVGPFRRDRAPRGDHQMFYFPVGTVLRNPETEAWMIRREDGTWVHPGIRRNAIDAGQFRSLYESGITEVMNIGCNS